MTPIPRYVALVALLLALDVSAQSRARLRLDDLYALVAKGVSCNSLVPDERLWRCEYKVGAKLKFSIVTQDLETRHISISHADVFDDYYLVITDGCVSVMPALGHPTDSASSLAVYVSPVDGRVYRRLDSCKAAK